jgi:hypothetical protein
MSTIDRDSGAGAYTKGLAAGFAAGVVVIFLSPR